MTPSNYLLLKNKLIVYSFVKSNDVLSYNICIHMPTYKVYHTRVVIDLIIPPTHFYTRSLTTRHTDTLTLWARDDIVETLTKAPSHAVAYV